MNNYLHLICDYAPGDMAWAEVFSAMCAGLPGTVRMHMSSVSSFDTIATGFLVAQLGNAEENLRPKDLLIFANCAPRKDVKQARANNEGEGLLFCTLKNGVQIIAVNSGFSLSFVKNDIREVWSTVSEDHGSQFRSRDYFPQKVWAAVSEDYSFLLHKLDAAMVIPEPPQEAIAYIDSFGNMKTSFRSGNQLPDNFIPGSRLKVRIGGVIRTATVATGSFNVLEGDLAFAPGSSGQDRKYWELFQRGGSAWREFGNPPTGSTVHIDVAE
ncbi:SAM-dependent chlorinase/fluorinase [soil metagenome]